MEPLFFSESGSTLEKPEDVIPLLAKAYHWREGRSAYETAHSWLSANGLPRAIRAVLDTDSTFRDASLLKAVFEKQTQLDALGRPSQTDVFALLQIPSGRAVLGIEAKVDESFGPLVNEWAEGTSTKRRRLQGLVKRLGIDEAAADRLRYQLIHRTAAILIEAKLHDVGDAAMIVQSFSPPELRAGFADFQTFAAMIGASVEQPGTLSRPLSLDGVRLRLGWAQDRIRSGTPMTGQGTEK